MRITTEVIGLKELDQALRDLRAEMKGNEKNIVATSMRNAAKDTVLFAQVSAAARHVKSGRLLNALEVRRHPNPSHLSELFGVGVHKTGKRPGKGEKDSGPLPWYAAVVEFGGWNKAGPLRGFIRQSLENNRDRFVKQFANEAGTRIEKAARKIGNTNLQKVGSKIKNL